MGGFPFLSFHFCFISGPIKNRKLFLKLPGMFVQSAQKSATSHRLEARKAIAGRPSRIICPGDQHSTTHAASQFLRLVPEHCPYLLSNGLTAVYHHSPTMSIGILKIHEKTRSPLFTTARG
jgi:hypothetical protein